jgi:hypothetical protein
VVVRRGGEKEGTEINGEHRDDEERTNRIE